MKNDSSERVLTTGQIAKLCRVSPRTVSKWFDTGRLSGFRIPGSNDRRVPLPEVIRFMRSHGIPTDLLDQGRRRIVVFCHDPDLSLALLQHFAEHRQFEVHLAESAFQAGVLSERLHPQVLLVCGTAPDLAPRTFCRALRNDPLYAGVRLIAFGVDVPEGRRQRLLHEGFDEFICFPFDPSVLLQEAGAASD